MEIEVVLHDGKVITATAANHHQDMFWAIRGSYGTLGRLTLCTLKLQSVVPARAISGKQQPTMRPAGLHQSRVDVRCDCALIGSPSIQIL